MNYRFKENVNMIRKLARTYEQNTGIDYDDLFGEGCLAYCEAVQTYDSGKSVKLITYAYWCVRNRLMDYCIKETRAIRQPVPLSSLPESLHPVAEIEREFNFEEYTDNWSAESKAIARMVLNTPEKFMGRTPNFKRSGGKIQRIREELRHHNWLHREIDIALREIKLHF